MVKSLAWASPIRLSGDSRAPLCVHQGGWNVNRQVFDKLLALKQRDTDMRSRLLQEGKLYGDYAPEMQQVHRENAKRLDEIIAKHSWPGVSLVGLEGCRAA